MRLRIRLAAPALVLLKDSIPSIELVKGLDRTALIVLAATVEGFE